jgi:hypothetical protein
MKLPIPMLPSTLPATTSALESPKPVAQQAAEVWDVSLFDRHEKNRIMNSVLRNFNLHGIVQ